jgi:hypothetical protein
MSMSDCSDHKNPFQHNGTSQAQRLLTGMDEKKYALADEKGFADWIVFASEFSRYIKYYNIENQAKGNWEAFFNNDISAQLGRVAIQVIERYRIEVKERFDYIRDDDNSSSIDVIRLKLNELFSAVLTLSKALDDTMLGLPKETTLKYSIQNLIQTKLAAALKRFIAYHSAAETLGYLNHTISGSWYILNQPLSDAGQIITNDGLGNDWLYDTDKTNWSDYTGTILEDNSIFNNPLTGFSEDYRSIEHASNHNLFTGIFDTFLSSYTKIILDAEAELLKSLESYNEHSAHYALLLSFLKLYRLLQEDINTLTGRHLDFYYKEVLKLQPRSALANQVHILGELAKQVDDYLLAEGTGLKAGKDSEKKDVSYTVDADTVLNKAKVAHLKALYKSNAEDTVYYPGTSTVKQNNENRIFASPVVNSDDGQGEELTSDNKEWHPFVHKIYEEAELQSIAMPKAQLGFALASHYLYLTEGERKVFLRFVTNPASILVGKKIECWLTTEKEWYQVDSPVIASSGKKLSNNITNCTEISFTIPGSDDAIVNYNAAVHGGTFDCDLPVLKVYLKNENNTDYEYDLLKDVTLSKVEIRVEVGMDGSYSQNGLKNLFLSNDYGVLDASKPIMPFGAQPTPGSKLVIGSKEIFSKKNAQVKLNIEWKDLPVTRGEISYVTLSDSGNYPNIALASLEGGVWNTKISSTEMFSSSGSSVSPTKQISSSTGIFNNTLADFDEDYSPFGINSSRGFIAMKLLQPFGHKDYLKDYTEYLIDKSLDKPDLTEPKEPYTPIIVSLYASYSAYCTNDVTSSDDFDEREIKFFHIYPFGEGEEHKYLHPGEEVYLLPQFKHSVEGTVVPHTGEFYIGIEKLESGQAVNILFQILEGTSDPTVMKPEEHIHWSYLGNNRWIDFEPDELSDNTLDLVQSGIISFVIPEQASTKNSILPSGYIWIRAAVKESAEAVCKLLTVDAQAVAATFSDNDNADDFLDTPLASGTISKLKTPDASVKKLTQPYPSFGGRQKESDRQFYNRVSERLRHKARAITVWDYERLVLEAFPDIYKVKCLNHTQVDDGIYNEVRPGYVSIITIPALNNRNDANPLKPYTQQDTLTRIEEYLKKRTSCFVKLRACQPQFEEVRMEFSLKLLDDYKDFTFYSNKLKEEITQFLSPWAYGNSSTLDFGGKVYKSVLIDFIEERYYVDYLTDVFMYVKVNDGTLESADQDEILASTARSILVSTPSTKHVIHEITEEEESTSEPCFDT